MGRRGSREKNLQTNIWKIIKLTERLLAKLHPSKLGEYNVLPSILTFQFTNCVKFNFGKKLFAIGFPYKHCNS